MKTTAFVVFYAGVLITLDNGVLASESDKREENFKAKSVKETVPPPRPSFPLLTLPSFSSFSLPAINFPYLQAFAQRDRVSPSDGVRETKTEYVEVTRRQTVHPVCYTAYEAKGPCLPYSQDFQEDDYDSGEPEVVHQTHDGFNLNEVRKTIHSISAAQKDAAEGSTRSGKYLEFKLRKNWGAETSSRIEGSEFFPTLNRIPPQQHAAEYHTKTVLITKLEKYTDRRVTATLLAVNCLPVDRTIPMCQSYSNPIREAPDRRSDVHFESSDFSPTLTSYGTSESKIPDDTLTSVPIYNKTKTRPTAFNGVFEPAEVNTEETLLGEEKL